MELNRQLQAQLSGVREEHHAVLEQLKEAHSLLDKHIDTCNRAQQNEASLSLSVAQTKHLYHH